jgi:hypothetical protein
VAQYHHARRHAPILGDRDPFAADDRFSAPVPQRHIVAGQRAPGRTRTYGTRFRKSDEVTGCGRHQATLPSRSPSTPAVAAVVGRASSPNSSPTASTGTAGLEHGTHIGRRAMWAFYRQPMPRCAVAACARGSQGVALRSRAVSPAHAGGPSLGSKAYRGSCVPLRRDGFLPRSSDRSSLGGQLDRRRQDRVDL